MLLIHIDYFKGKGGFNPKPGELSIQKAGWDCNLKTQLPWLRIQRKFNANLGKFLYQWSMPFINLFKQIFRMKKNSGRFPIMFFKYRLCFFPSFSMIAKEGDQQSQRLLQILSNFRKIWKQEKKDNKQKIPKRRKSLDGDSLVDSTIRSGTSPNNKILIFYYQDIQRRIKDQKFSNKNHVEQIISPLW